MTAITGVMELEKMLSALPSSTVEGSTEREDYEP